MMALNTLASSRNSQSQSRPSLLPSGSVDGILSSDAGSEVSDSESNADGDGGATPRGAHVTFAKDDEVNIMTPVPSKSSSLPHESNSPPSDSGASTPGSEDSLATSPIAKTIADRLSFWTRLSKRTPESLNSADDVIVSEAEQKERLSLNSLSGSDTHNVISSIIAATAPPPASAEEQKSELENKIVRECVKEFTKGGMYFAYNFGRSLYHLLAWHEFDSKDHRYYPVATTQTSANCQI